MNLFSASLFAYKCLRQFYDRNTQSVFRLEKDRQRSSVHGSNRDRDIYSFAKYMQCIHSVSFFVNEIPSSRTANKESLVRT